MNKFVVLAALMLLLSACGGHKHTPFETKIHASLERSLTWRNDSTGIWETAGWWNSANLLTAVIRYADVTKNKGEVLPVIEDVFEKARHYPVADSTGALHHYCDNFINDYYDDEGWWALAWIDAFRLTNDTKYLKMAEVIFQDMTTGWSDDVHGGGIFWKKNPLHYKNSIANNLFALTSIRLYNDTGKEEYADWFKKEVNWYLQTGMYNTEINQIEDGLMEDGTPNRKRHYTYNQGVAIAVLTEMYLYSHDKKFLNMAEDIAKATITKELVNENGILCEMNPNVAKGNDGVQFKGIFIRHLGFLYETTNNPIYKEFIIKNAESIITKDFDPESMSFGCYWYGPFQAVNAAANSSALECVIEAQAIY